MVILRNFAQAYRLSFMLRPSVAAIALVGEMIIRMPMRSREGCGLATLSDAQRKKRRKAMIAAFLFVYE